MLRLSNSEMSTFRRCKRKWYLNTYRRLALKRSNPYGSALSVGNLVHDSLAAYYDPNIGIDPVLHARNTVEEAIAQNPGYEIEIRKEWDLVDAMLSGYMEWLEDTGEDSDLKIIGAERMVSVPMTGTVTLISKLDAPVERISDGSKLALEHKTTGSLEQPIEVHKINSQFLTEHLVRFLDAQQKGATAEEAYDQCTGILVNMLRKVKRTARAKPPFYGRVEVEHNIHELRAHWKHVLAIAKEIEATTVRLDAGEDPQIVAPPSPMGDCTWSCPFFKICPMFNDNSRVEDAIEAMYEERDPLERYEGAEEL